MARVSHAGAPERSGVRKLSLFGLYSIAWKSGLVSADRWRGGLLRLAAQKRERKQQRRQTVVEGAVETSGVDVPEGDH